MSIAILAIVPVVAFVAGAYWGKRFASPRLYAQPPERPEFKLRQGGRIDRAGMSPTRVSNSSM